MFSHDSASLAADASYRDIQPDAELEQVCLSDSASLRIVDVLARAATT
jgi:hypothetical protein